MLMSLILKLKISVTQSKTLPARKFVQDLKSDHNDVWSSFCKKFAAQLKT